MPFGAMVSCGGFFLPPFVFCAVIPLPGAGMIRLIENTVIEFLPGVLHPVLPSALQKVMFISPAPTALHSGEIKRGIK